MALTKITNDGVTGLSIDSSGRILMTARPFIKMNMSSNQSATTSAVGNILPLQNVISSSGITLNTTTYKFQVPVTGLYNVSGSARVNAAATYIWWTIADGSGTHVNTSQYVLGNSNFTSGSTASGSILASLTASTDYQIVQGSSLTGSQTFQQEQNFIDIFLVG